MTALVAFAVLMLLALALNAHGRTVTGRTK